MTSLENHIPPSPGVFRRCKSIAALSLCTLVLPAFAQLFTPGITESFGSGPTYTPTHFVDFAAGSESNSGTSSASPWKFAPGMPGSSRTPSAGHVIALKRGSVWRLTSTWSINASGTSSNPIVFTAYGNATDPLPKVTVLEDIKGTSGTWTAAGTGYPNVYYRTITGTVERVYLNGVGQGESVATAPATENWVGQSYKVTCLALPVPNPNNRVVGAKYDTGIVKAWKQATVSGQVRLYLHSPGGSPHTLANTTVEALKTGISYAVQCLNRSHVYLDRINFNGGTVAIVDLRCGAGATFATNVRVTNCDVRCGQAKGINAWSLSEEDTVAPIDPRGFTSGVIKWNRVDSGDGPGTRATDNNDDFGRDLPSYSYPNESVGGNDGISLWNGVQNWTIAQNDVSNFWHSNINISRTNPPQNPVIVVTSGNLVEHNSSHSENINYSHGLSIGCDEVEAVAYRTNNNVGRYNHVYNTWSGGSLKGRNVKFYGNLVVGVYGSPKEPIDHIAWQGAGYMVLGFDNPGGFVIEGGVNAYNTYVNIAGAAINFSDFNGKPPQGYLIANNIMAYCGHRHNPANIVLRDSDDNASNVDVDNNLLFSPNTSAVYHLKVTSNQTMTVAQMESAQPSWDGNIQADPQFISYTGINATGNYQLKTTSPAWGTAKDITNVLPESAGWTDIGCWQEAGATTFANVQTLSTGTFNGINGWKGMKITVGANDIVATDVGRWVLAGNTQTHAVGILNAAGTVIGSASVNANDPFAVGRIKYADLPAPITLLKNTIYYVMSQETLGGDLWYGSTTTLVPTGAATINNAAKYDGVFTNDNATPNTCSVPVSFKYYQPANFITGQTLSTGSFNGITGWKGMKITIGSTPMIVTHLGRWVLGVHSGSKPANTQPHVVRVFSASGANLGQVSVTTAGAPQNQMKYVELSAPVVLAANTVYYVMSQEALGGDYWWGSATSLSHTPAATVDGAVKWDTVANPTFTIVIDSATPNSCNVPVGFKYY